MTKIIVINKDINKKWYIEENKKSRFLIRFICFFKYGEKKGMKKK